MSDAIERVATAAERRCAELVALLAESARAELPGVTVEASEAGVTLSGQGLRRRALDDARLRDPALLLAGRR